MLPSFVKIFPYECHWLESRILAVAYLTKTNQAAFFRCHFELPVPILFYLTLLLLLSTEFLYKNTITSAPISHHSYLTLSLPHQFFLPAQCLPLQPLSISLATFLLPAAPPAPDIHSTRTLPLPPWRQLLLLHNPQNSRGKKTATSAFKFLLLSCMQHCNVASCRHAERGPTTIEAN